jgi:hypothetical protein
VHAALVRSRFDLAVAENPEVQSQMDRVMHHSRAWSILEGLAELSSVIIELVGQTSVLGQMIRSREDARIFGLVCIARPLVSQILWIGSNARTFRFIYSCQTPHSCLSFFSLAYYAMVTNIHWLRMSALFKLGTSIEFKKEVLSGGLDSFINSRMYYFRSPSDY